MALQFNTSQLEHAITEMSVRSSRSESEQVRFNAIDMLKSIAYNSPRRTGSMNAGWYAAWHGLDIPGRPNTQRRSAEPFTPRKSKRQMVPEGTFTDHRDQTPAAVEFTNDSHVILPDGRRVNYPNIVEDRQHFMARAESEVARKWERRLEKMLRREARRSGW